MEAHDQRTLVSQLADDFTWLEQHARGQAELSPHTAPLRIASGLIRNVVGPFLDRQPALPLHIVVVGGAGTGKSTIVNFLTGRVIAEANPQAGFTRHPIAYVARTANEDRAALPWTSHLGFLGPLQLLSEAAPSNLDEDVYQIRRVAASRDDADAATGVLRDAVVWDCPDMTTWAATNYVPRLLEVAALADVIVYVASDERYNDVVPTQFLHLLVQTGKPVVVVLTKMREVEAAPLAAHFEREVLARLPHGIDGRPPMVPVLTVPFLTPDQLADPVQKAAKYRIPLMNQISVLTNPPDATRQRTVRHAMHFLTQETNSLLTVAKNDLQVLDVWQSLVQHGRDEFNQRYRREYLTGEPFRRFEDSRAALMDLLELPSAGRVLTFVFWILRAPYRLLRSLFTQMMTRPEGVNLPEHTVLDGALDAWLDQLRSDALQRAGQHPIWKHITAGFDGGLSQQAQQEFESHYRNFQLSVADEVEGARQSITTGLQQNAGLLFMLRLGKLTIDLTAVGIAFWLCGLTLWLLLAIPLLVSLGHQIVEIAVRSYVDAKREQVRRRQESLVAQHLATPVADWLSKWPVSGGSTFERMQRALRRVPETISKLTDMVQQRIQEKPIG